MRLSIILAILVLLVCGSCRKFDPTRGKRTLVLRDDFSDNTNWGLTAHEGAVLDSALAEIANGQLHLFADPDLDASAKARLDLEPYLPEKAKSICIEIGINYMELYEHGLSLGFQPGHSKITWRHGPAVVDVIRGSGWYETSPGILTLCIKRPNKPNRFKVYAFGPDGKDHSEWFDLLPESTASDYSITFSVKDEGTIQNVEAYIDYIEVYTLD